jgi:hypothetical protein
VRFDAEEWVDLIRAAGQRYMVLTTKHHDGFAMFDTRTTDYRITAGPFGRDVTGELAKACEAGGIGFGTYFSAPDFHDPGYRDLARPLPEVFLGQPERPEWAGFLDRMEAQVREVATQLRGAVQLVVGHRVRVAVADRAVPPAGAGPAARRDHERPARAAWHAEVTRSWRRTS